MHLKLEKDIVRDAKNVMVADLLLVVPANIAKILN